MRAVCVQKFRTPVNIDYPTGVLTSSGEMYQLPLAWYTQEGGSDMFGQPHTFPLQLPEGTGCHMQPAVALFGIRRFNRGNYSLRPGEPLSDYVAPQSLQRQFPS
ncbi:MAG: hypothetical protein GY940_05995 [bacterium]|nr:hypothetical protein [bacterium]